MLLFGIVLSDEVDSQCHYRKTYTASCQCVKKLNLRQLQMTEGNQHGALQRKKRNQCIGKSYVSDGCQKRRVIFSAFAKIDKSKAKFRKGIYGNGNHNNGVIFRSYVLRHGEICRADEHDIQQEKQITRKISEKDFVFAAIFLVFPCVMNHGKTHDTENEIICRKSN